MQQFEIELSNPINETHVIKYETCNVTSINKPRFDTIGV